jgi:hypothetical protein
MKTFKWVLLAALFPVFAFAQGATVVTVEGEGQSGFLDARDSQTSFEEAKRRAERAAIEAAAGVRLQAQTLVVNNQLVKDEIMAHTSGFLKSSEVISKNVDKSVWTVKVKAQVITENLDKEIAAARDLVKRIGRPTLLIIIQEQTVIADGKGVANTDNVAAVLADRFRADGWDLKDEKTLDKKALALEGAVTFGATEIKRIADNDTFLLNSEIRSGNRVLGWIAQIHPCVHLAVNRQKCRRYDHHRSRGVSAARYIIGVQAD